ncbi:Long chain acyl-CoA synthetase 4 [Glycine max]|nr:Long chain acyl-CoA synthetase 4 [Glycine max]
MLWNLLYAMQRSRWHLLKKRRYLSTCELWKGYSRTKARSLKVWVSNGHNMSFDLPVKKKSDVCTIMYTSGTTGDLKGVLITNESIITLSAGIQQLLKNVYLSYLPLAHIFDRVIEETMIMHGASIGCQIVTGRYWRAKADHFGCVPVCLIECTMLHNMTKGQNHVEASPLFDRIVFNKVGGNVHIILSGAAPLSRHVEVFLRVVTCAHILQGYGTLLLKFDQSCSCHTILVFVLNFFYIKRKKII